MSGSLTKCRGGAAVCRSRRSMCGCAATSPDAARNANLYEIVDQDLTRRTASRCRSRSSRRRWGVSRWGRGSTGWICSLSAGVGYAPGLPIRSRPRRRSTFPSARIWGCRGRARGFADRAAGVIARMCRVINLGMCGPKGVKFKFGFSRPGAFRDDGGRRVGRAVEELRCRRQVRRSRHCRRLTCRWWRRDGTMNSDWYKWLVAFVAIVTKIRSEIP